MNAVDVFRSRELSGCFVHCLCPGAPQDGVSILAIWPSIASTTAGAEQVGRAREERRGQVIEVSSSSSSHVATHARADGLPWRRSESADIFYTDAALVDLRHTPRDGSPYPTSGGGSWSSCTDAREGVRQPAECQTIS